MSVYDFSARKLDGEEASLSMYRGKVLLIVNVASKCGFTPQYEGLQALAAAYREQGLEVLGFPCNQFAHQEPGDADQIRQYCRSMYNVDFTLFEKIDVNGKNAHPLYQHLKKEARGFLGTQAVKWNFTKFLVDREGSVIRRFPSKTTPDALKEHIEALL